MTIKELASQVPELEAKTGRTTRLITTDWINALKAIWKTPREMADATGIINTTARDIYQQNNYSITLGNYEIIMTEIDNLKA